jgi:hypothetical protein
MFRNFIKIHKLVPELFEWGGGVAIALMMETPSTSETPVNFYQTTRRNIPEDSHLHTRRRENLKNQI